MRRNSLSPAGVFDTCQTLEADRGKKTKVSPIKDSKIHDASHKSDLIPGDTVPQIPRNTTPAGGRKPAPGIGRIHTFVLNSLNAVR